MERVFAKLLRSRRLNTSRKPLASCYSETLTKRQDKVNKSNCSGRKCKTIFGPSDLRYNFPRYQTATFQLVDLHQWENRPRTDTQTAKRGLSNRIWTRLGFNVGRRSAWHSNMIILGSLFNDNLMDICYGTCAAETGNMITSIFDEGKVILPTKASPQDKTHQGPEPPVPQLLYPDAS